MPKARPPYPAAFRQQMVDDGSVGGRTPEDLAREFKPSAQTIRIRVVQAGRLVAVEAALAGVWRSHGFRPLQLLRLA